ncbi:aromatase/cyclase [Streptomyces acidiscabies]|uniref:aromatase/cyclase n=1 Tax=Streptomyces acidiscabies TaxID=42234 RepID=UPI00073EEEC2|nr:aromatase/cyclase [Streptomyces acidiscabies]GAQ51146.1 polyketide cyclase / dehydrase and lipid transport [Streptomyces acidiscabies]
MNTPEIHARHETEVDAPPSTVYDLITDVSLWPVIFRPTVHTEVLERTPQGDRFQIWATVAGGEVSTWRSRRTFDAAARRVTFRQDHDNPLFGLMGGGWSCLPLAGGRTEVVLEHSFVPPPDQADARERIARTLDANGAAELEALRTASTLPGGLGAWLVTFTETIGLTGTADAARAFIWDADRWPERLPHVAGLDLLEQPGGAQDMTMRTRAPDGTVHTTRSLRLLLPDGSIVYKQTRPPRALLGHSGRWAFDTDPSGSSTITSTHTFLLDPAGAADVYGPDVPAPEAAQRVRTALAANSRITMQHADRYSASVGAP